MTKAERENDPADTFDGGYHLYAEEAHRERVAKNPSRISYAISQLDQILAVLESGGTLTALDALEDFGCSRLASRITDLKRRGVPVASRMVQRRNRYGRLCRVAEYYLEC